jgi:hypothetical protein
MSAARPAGEASLLLRADERRRPGGVNATMSTDVAVPEAQSERFEVSLEAEHEAERDLLTSLVRAIVISIPIMVAVFVLMTAIAISDKTEWYVWLGLGVGLGVIAAFLLGSLAGATINAHKLDEVDRVTQGLEPDAP